MAQPDVTFAGQNWLITPAALAVRNTHSILHRVSDHITLLGKIVSLVHI